MPTSRLTRKTFLRMSFGVIAVGVVGCGSDSGDGTDSAASGTTDGTGPSSTGNPPATGTSSTTGDPSTTGAETSGGSGTTGSDSGSSSSGSSDSGSTSEGAEPNCGRNGASTQFDIHDHDLEISADMLQPGTALEGLAILGSGHPHSLDLTGEQVDALLAGESVTATSSFGSGHEHQVTIECI